MALPTCHLRKVNFLQLRKDTGYAAGRGIKLLPLASLDFFTSFEGEGIRGKDDSILQHRGHHTILSRAMLVDAFDVRC